MLQHCWKSRVRVAAIGSAIGLIVIAVGSARAQDTLDDNVVTRTEKKIYGSIMRGLGLRGPDDPQIEYRERSPLVVPPSRDLPPPSTSSAKANPAWPVDPDAKRAKERADAKKKRRVGNFDPSVDNPTALSPDELNAPGAPARRTGPNTFDPGTGAPMSPNDLGFSGFTLRAFGFGGQQEEASTFTAEPPRASLTAPPAGYQTPSPAYPYGVSKRQEQTQTRVWDQAVGGYQ